MPLYHVTLTETDGEPVLKEVTRAYYDELKQSLGRWVEDEVFIAGEKITSKIIEQQRPWVD